MEQATTQNAYPRLMELPEEGTALKPQELENRDITILNRMQTIMPDGRTAYKWLVRREDSSVGLYWSAGDGPTMQVDQWFRDNPTMPLPCRLYRQVNQHGTSVWRITQRTEDSSVTEAGARQTEIDAQLTEVGL